MKLPKYISLQYTCLFLLCVWEKIDGVIHSGAIAKKYNNPATDFTIHKVSLTQIGYIQFLRYISDVPPLTDYTFCVWVRSRNLNHSHPLLSYSKHEEERLIRVWISPHGTHLNLEILQIPVFEVPVNLVENHWYHICQSWSSNQAAWNLYLNGKLKTGGVTPKLRGIPIKEGGDIVVGQEYTDFDKGLDDGIEGDVFGFNFVLSPTSVSLKHPINSVKHSNYPLRRHFDQSKKYYSTKPLLNIYNPPAYPPFRKQQFSQQKLPLYNRDQPFLDTFEETNTEETQVPSVLSYFNVQPNREPKGLLTDVGRNIWSNLFNFFEPEQINYNPGYHQKKIVIHPANQLSRENLQQYPSSRITNEIHESTAKPLGLKLVELSFNCGLGKGAPLSGQGVLISWTKTPVRVFGGAILKNVPPFCQ